MDTGKSLRKTGISPSGEIPSCPHNALLEILSRNHARVVPDGFLRDLLVSLPARSLNYSHSLKWKIENVKWKKREMLVKSLTFNEILMWLKRAQATPEFQTYRHFL